MNLGSYLFLIDKPKIGIRDRSGSVVGFVFCSYNETLKNLKALIAQEVGYMFSFYPPKNKLFFIIFSVIFRH